MLNQQIVGPLAQKIEDLTKQIETSPTRNVWFRSLLIDILNASARELRHLQLGFEKSTSITSWACRNSLELTIIAKYVLSNRQNADSFTNDLLIDGKEMFHAARDWVQLYMQEASDPVLQTIANLEREITKRGVIQKKHLEIADMAKAVNYHEEYRTMNRLTSKLVHMSAFSIMEDPDEGELAFLRMLLCSSGVRYIAQTYQDIGEYFEEKGVEPTE
jgi:uncharacterized protein DUF5677